MIRSLNDIGVACGTDKSTLYHGYLDFYEELLSKFRNRPFVMFEVGVYHGSSLRMWADFFPDATIVGLDVDGRAKNYENGNARVRIGDATRLEFLDVVAQEFGRPLVVIDDGSHKWCDQQETFQYLWPRVLPGGYLVMEDIHTSFPVYAEGFVGQARISTFDYLQNLSRWVVSRGELGEEQAEDSFIFKCWPTVHSITHFGRTVVVRKRDEAA